MRKSNRILPFQNLSWIKDRKNWCTTDPWWKWNSVFRNAVLNYLFGTWKKNSSLLTIPNSCLALSSIASVPLVKSDTSALKAKFSFERSKLILYCWLNSCLSLKTSYQLPFPIQSGYWMSINKEKRMTDNIFTLHPYCWKPF